jgi:hypothetical protein
MNRMQVKRQLLHRYVHMLEVELKRAYRPLPTMVCGDELPLELTLANMQWMCTTALADLETLPDDKVQRWIGFVQYGLCLYGCTTVQAERDFTRPLMHAVYAAEGLAIPPTRSMTTKGH